MTHEELIAMSRRHFRRNAGMAAGLTVYAAYAWSRHWTFGVLVTFFVLLFASAATADLLVIGSAEDAQ